MADEKKSFVLYTDLIHTVRKMPKDKVGDLFLTILSYVNDENPNVDDLIVDLVFEPIKLQLKRDLVKYEEKRGKNSDNGKEGGIKSGEKRRLLSEARKNFNSKPSDCELIESEIESNEANASNTLQNEANASNTFFVEANEAVTVIDNENVNENVSVIIPHSQKDKNNSFKNYPLDTDVGELPDFKNDTVIELLKITKNYNVNRTQINGMWKVFKTQNLTGKKHYPTIDDVYSHFINWIRLQTFITPEVTEKKHKGEEHLSAIVRQINESERLKNLQANGK